MVGALDIRGRYFLFFYWFLMLAFVVLDVVQNLVAQSGQSEASWGFLVWFVYLKSWKSSKSCCNFVIEGFVVIETFSKFWEWSFTLWCVREEKLAFFDKLNFLLFLCFNSLCDVLINTALVKSITNLQAFFNWHFSREVSLMSIRICLWINFCDWDGVVSAAWRPARA